MFSYRRWVLTISTGLSTNKADSNIRSKLCPQLDIIDQDFSKIMFISWVNYTRYQSQLMLSVWVKYCVLLQEFQKSDHNIGFLGIGLITEKPVHTNAVLNRFRPRQNVRHFEKTIVRFWMTIGVLWCKFHTGLFIRVQLTIKLLGPHFLDNDLFFVVYRSYTELSRTTLVFINVDYESIISLKLLTNLFRRNTRIPVNMIFFK